MHEVTGCARMNTLKSVSVFVGTGECNARCNHCAGVVHRKYAPKEDGIIDGGLINKTLRDCYEKGSRYLSVSSSGEPTLSPLAVTKVLELVNGLRKEGIEYSPINLYSNGIRIGEDERFCREYLPKWKNLGLTTMYVTVHDIDEKKNALLYGVRSYPSLELILNRIHNSGLLMRANLVLSKNTIDTFEKFVYTINHLEKIGVDSVSAWPIRGVDDLPSRDLSPSKEEFEKMKNWTFEKRRNGYKITLLGEKNREEYQKGHKLTLFPDGTLSSSWCN